MEAEVARLQAGLAQAEAQIADLNRDMRTLLSMIQGMSPQIIRTPSGVSGFNNTYEILAQPLGAEETETASSGTFICSYNSENGTITVGGGSYENPLGTNTDVQESTVGTGKYAYVIIKHSSAGVFDSFKIEVSTTTKDPTNMDAEDSFAEFSNCLLAEVVGSGDDAQLVQRRVGNFTLYHRVVDGKLCLWPETTNGSLLL